MFLITSHSFIAEISFDSFFILWKCLYICVNVTPELTVSPPFLHCYKCQFLLADALKSVVCLLDMFSHKKHTSVCFCMGCKTLVDGGWEKNAGWAFTHKLHLYTIFAVPEMFCQVLKLVELNLVSAERIWFCWALSAYHCISPRKKNFNCTVPYNNIMIS